MTTLPPDIFVDLRTAHRLSCHTVYRLQHLAARHVGWQEETFTEVLLGYLAGSDFTVEADCPEIGSGHDRRACPWPTVSTKSTVGSVRLLKRHEEGGNKKTGKRGVGADFIYAVENSSGTRETRLICQAKLVHAGRNISRRDIRKKQFDDLQNAARTYNAAAYYVFYADSGSAHISIPTRCRRHISPQDTAIVLVSATVVDNLLIAAGRGGVSQQDLFAAGRTLMCLTGCAGGDDATIYEQFESFVMSDPNDYQPSSPAIEVPTARYPAVRVTSVSQKPPRGATLQRPSGLRPIPPGSILWVLLTDWRDERDSTRKGRGWYDGMPAEQLLESVRKYWRLDPRKATLVEYIVASHKGVIVGAYRVRHDSLIKHIDRNGKFSFELDLLVDETIYSEIIDRTILYLVRRPRRARNIVGYP